MAEFTVFENLPAELRIKIWKLNLPRNRTVYIYRGCPAGERIIGTGIHKTYQDNIPVNLHVCHESRAEALKSYKPFFNDKKRGYFQYNLGQSILKQINFKPIYFDQLHDTLEISHFHYFAKFFEWKHPCLRLVHEFFKEVRHLSIKREGGIKRNEVDLLAYFSKLETLMLHKKTKKGDVYFDSLLEGLKDKLNAQWEKKLNKKHKEELNEKREKKLGTIDELPFEHIRKDWVYRWIPIPQQNGDWESFEKHRDMKKDMGLSRYSTFDLV